MAIIGNIPHFQTNPYHGISWECCKLKKWKHRETPWPCKIDAKCLAPEDKRQSLQGWCALSPTSGENPEQFLHLTIHMLSWFLQEMTSLGLRGLCDISRVFSINSVHPPTQCKPVCLSDPQNEEMDSHIRMAYTMRGIRMAFGSHCLTHRKALLDLVPVDSHTFTWSFHVLLSYFIAWNW